MKKSSETDREQSVGALPNSAWRWDPSRKVEEIRPSAGQLRRRAVVHGLIGGAISGGLFFLGRPRLATFAATLTTLMLCAGLLSPIGAYWRLQQGLEWLGVRVGRLMAWLFLAPLYFLFFTPFGWLLRRGTKDQLQGRFDPEAESYWSPRSEEKPGLERYKRQF